MAEKTSLLIYGANGYSGAIVSRLAAAQGLAPILAGRDGSAVAAIAAAGGLRARTFGLSDPAAVAAGLEGIAVVLHCAGPFSRTARPMIDACLRTGTHYLDITGEFEVFQTCEARDAEARASGVMLLPGCGLDIVPSDCLAAHVKRRLPSATHLALGMDGVDRPFSLSVEMSQGTLRTMIESDKFHHGLVREDGLLKVVPLAQRTRLIDMGRGPRRAVTIPWADVVTAYHSTGIANIEFYLAAPRPVAWLLRALGPALDLAPVQRALKAAVRLRPAGPTDATRAHGQVHLWAEARDGARTVSARLKTPQGHVLTAEAALTIARRVLSGDHKLGYQTPSSAYGPDLVLEIPGCARSDEPPRGS